MKRLIPLLSLFIISCASSTIGKWDQLHATYNSVAEVAVETAENPVVDAKLRKQLADVVVRTAPVVEKGAEIVSRRQCTENPELATCEGVKPISSDDEAYLRWSFEVVKQAMAQLTEAYYGEVGK